MIVTRHVVLSSPVYELPELLSRLELDSEPGSHWELLATLGASDQFFEHRLLGGFNAHFGANGLTLTNDAGERVPESTWSDRHVTLVVSEPTRITFGTSLTPVRCSPEIFEVLHKVLVWSYLGPVSLRRIRTGDGRVQELFVAHPQLSRSDDFWLEQGYRHVPFEVALQVDCHYGGRQSQAAVWVQAADELEAEAARA